EQRRRLFGAFLLDRAEENADSLRDRGRNFHQQRSGEDSSAGDSPILVQRHRAHQNRQRGDRRGFEVSPSLADRPAGLQFLGSTFSSGAACGFWFSIIPRSPG